MAKQVSNSEKSKWHSLRNALSLLGSVYSAILLIGLLASLLVQIIPVLENPIAIEVARLFTVMFASVLVSYVAIRQVGKGISRRLEKENLELRE
jgi:Co/Zn/Cd efflux system component